MLQVLLKPKMRATHAIALMLMLAAVASCSGQDYEILEGLGLVSYGVFSDTHILKT